MNTATVAGYCKIGSSVRFHEVLQGPTFMFLLKEVLEYVMLHSRALSGLPALHNLHLSFFPWSTEITNGFPIG